VGAVPEGLAEGLLLGDERALTECNATSQFGTFGTCRMRRAMSEFEGKAENICSR
jgi:hypothetical protein